MDFFGFLLSEVHWAPSSWICRFMSFARFRKYSATIYSNIFFMHHIFLPSFWNSSNTNVRLLVFFHAPKALFIFFSNLFSLYCSDWIISIDLSTEPKFQPAFYELWFQSQLSFESLPSTCWICPTCAPPSVSLGFVWGLPRSSVLQVCVCCLGSDARTHNLGVSPGVLSNLKGSHS